MTSDLWLANLAAWWAQTGVMIMLAALLLRMLPARSPRVALAYLQALLGACLLLPLIEPWRAAAAGARISQGAVSAVRVSAKGAVPVSIPRLILVFLAAGIVVRLTWLALGYLRLYGYRRHARSVDTAIASLQETIASRAEVYVSREVSGPVTFGFRRPTILLPAKWSELDPASRAAIACHELLHVRRNDWAFHVAEEIMRAVLWFHPAIWWLIAEIRLAREQVVDRLVVGITGAPKPYVEILLAFAGIDSCITAPAFTRKRHLARRIQSLLEEVSMTKSRLLVSFSMITLCLAVAGTVVVRSFPLQSVRSTFIAQDDAAPTSGIVGGVTGGVIGGFPGGVEGGVIGGVVGGVPEARSVAAGPQGPHVFKAGKNGVSTPRVLHKTDPEYTQEARDAKIEGTVVVRTEIHPDGRAHNTRVERSLDPGLDRKAVDAIAQWEFEPGKKDGKAVAVAATIEVNYRLN